MESVQQSMQLLIFKLARDASADFRCWFITRNLSFSVILSLILILFKADNKEPTFYFHPLALYFNSKQAKNHRKRGFFCVPAVCLPAVMLLSIKTCWRARPPTIHYCHQTLWSTFFPCSFDFIYNFKHSMETAERTGCKRPSCCVAFFPPIRYVCTCSS